MKYLKHLFVIILITLITFNCLSATNILIKIPNGINISQKITVTAPVSYLNTNKNEVVTKLSKLVTSKKIINNPNVVETRSGSIITTTTTNSDKSVTILIVDRKTGNRLTKTIRKDSEGIPYTTRSWITYKWPRIND